MSPRKKQRSLEWQLLVLVPLALTAFGLVMVYSATSSSAALGNGNPVGYLERQAAYALIGITLMICAARTDFRKLRALAPGLVIAALGLCVAVLVVGQRINGARRWIGFGPAAFQPSELAKLAILVWCAAYLSRKPPPRTLKDLGRPLGLLVGAFCVLILVEPDLGTVITIVVMVGAMLLVAGTPLPTLGSAYAIVFGLAAIASWASPYRRARLLVFLDPWKDPTNNGLQNVQALISLGSGGVFGRGLGMGVLKNRYLPEAHTDMIFAVIGEELGLIGVSLVMLAYCALAYAGLRLALTCRDPFGKRLAAGITALITGQAAINLAAVVGLAPLTGIPLPFVSYGGSSLVIVLLSVGILLNIARGHERAQAAPVSDRGRGHGGSRRPVARSGGSTARAGVEVTFAGSPDRVEARLVPERGYAFDAYRVAGFPRRPGPKLFGALGLAAAAPVACMRILARRQPDVVLGGGGYVAGPMVLAAWLRRIPAALTEADAHIGLANRLATPFVQRLFLAYPIRGTNGKARVVGRPIPWMSQVVTREQARRELGLPQDGPVVLVFGGSQGARTLNETAVDAWGDAGPAVLHLSGERDYDGLRDRVTRDDYRLFPFVHDLGLALVAADIVVSRAGGSVWEVAAAGLPAILVPYPHATSNHQHKNAEYFDRAGGVRIVEDDQAHELVPTLVRELLAHPEVRARMGDAMRAAAKPDAADKIADELVALAAAHR